MQTYCLDFLAVKFVNKPSPFKFNRNSIIWTRGQVQTTAELQWER